MTTLRLRQLLAVAVLAINGACADAITAPPSIDAEYLKVALPAVEDARTRIVQNIDNAGVRERISYDLRKIQLALETGDAHGARYHVHLVGTILDDYKKSGSAMSDGPEVSAIALALHTVALAVGGGFDIAAFR
jgi:hypothetical protein